MLTGRDKVLDFIKFNNYKYWRLRRTDTGPYLFVCLDENFTLDDSIRRLTEALNFLDPGNYFVECGDSSNDKRGWHKTPFRIEGGVYGIGIGNVPMSGIGITPEIVQEKINEAIARERESHKLEELEKKNKELETKNKELESEKDSFFLRLGNRLEPYIGTIIESFGLKPQQALIPARVSGIDEPILINKTMGEKVEDQQKRLEIAFEKWSKYESDPALLIEKIVDLAETSPKVYAKAKNILFNPALLNLLG